MSINGRFLQNGRLFPLTLAQLLPQHHPQQPIHHPIPPTLPTLGSNIRNNANILLTNDLHKINGRYHSTPPETSVPDR